MAKIKTDQSTIDSILEAMADIILRFNEDEEKAEIIAASDKFNFKISGDQCISLDAIFSKLIAQKFRSKINKALKANTVELTECEIEVPAGTFRFEAKILTLNTKEAIIILREITQEYKRQKLIRNYSVELEMKQMELENLYLKLDQELAKAKKIHDQILGTKFPKLADYTMAAFYQPAANIGGDFYNIIKVKNKLILYISDVTGHGLEAAMLSSFINSTINAYLAAIDSSELDPAAIVKFLTKQFFAENYPEDYFICITVLVLDLETDILEYTTQGMQDPILVYRENNNQPELKKIFNKGLPISPVLELDLFDFKVGEIKLEAGDTLIFNTDGITEASNAESYYQKHFRDKFSKTAFLPVEIISKKIKTDFINFIGGPKENIDDISYLILKKELKDENKFSYQLKSSSESIKNFQGEIYQLLPNSIKSDFFAMGLHELVVNAAEHGNKMDHNKNIKVNLIINEKYFYAEVEDEGPGFDWQKLVNRNFNICGNLNNDRGRGVMMTEESCDEFFYNQKGNKAYFFIKNDL